MIIDIDPRVDIVFHNLFGSPEHSRLTLSFINSLLTLSFINSLLERIGQPAAVDLEIADPFQLAKFLNQKESALDILYTDSTKRQIQLEMQIHNHSGLTQRMLHNWTQLYQRQLREGQSHDMHIPVITVWILNERIFKDANWLHVFRCYDKANGRILHDDLTIVCVELPVWLRQLDKDKPDRLDHLDKWLYF